jgi:predicted CoA-substrate-specific enzyme activase
MGLNEAARYMGIDVGSTTVKVVLTDEQGGLLDHVYVRAHGQPARTLWEQLQALGARWDLGQIRATGLTGSGGGTLAPLLGGLHVNELVAQTYALELIAPQARTVIEMGGQDSKLLLLEPDPENGHALLADFSTNTLCAAGTGSFLEQQAERLGIQLDELAALALQSEKPARIAGRCTVFAKSDMIHLQQRGVPTADIVAGLCLAVARNFRSIIGRGKPFRRPVLFQGGVARNAGMVRAFEQVLGLQPGELIVPPHCTLMAARGAAHAARQREQELRPFPGLAGLAGFLDSEREGPVSLPPLRPRSVTRPAAPDCPAAGAPRSVYLGVDVGSISTKVVLLDEQGVLLISRYLYTAGRPLEMVREGLRQVAKEIGAPIRVLAAGATGSGRHLVGDYIGADLVCNEISAQARAAAAFDPAADTILEIGGQDSKYIQLHDGVVVDFTMNKACAAGTGSFLEEQAQRLHLAIEEFGPLALAAAAPAGLGERCTVFMESDLVHHQQRGACRQDLVAGLAYSIAQNYLNRVVHDRPIGRRILFQGGVAANPAVVAAFEQLLGRPVEVPPHHATSGAIGAALLAQEEHARRSEGRRLPSSFRGFDLSQRTYESTAFECQGCPNHCEIQRVQVAGERPSFYGARCERYEEKGRVQTDLARLPDLFAEREALLLQDGPSPSALGRPRLGLPRVLFFYEQIPFWRRLFQELGWEVVVSPPTTPEIAARSAEESTAETCFPVKLAYGHVLALLEQGVERIFFPSLVNFAGPLPGQRQNYECPYIQAVPHLVRTAFELAGRPLPLWNLPLHFLWPEVMEREKEALARQVGVSLPTLQRAWEQAGEAQRAFHEACRERGKRALAELEPGARAAVLVGRPYNTADPGVNAGLPLKLRRLGVLPVPIDFLPLPWDESNIDALCDNMFWHAGQRILATAQYVRSRPQLEAIYVTNFGCGPDSFLLSYFQQAMDNRPFLELEIDDHSADAGLITRCEAFFDSLRMRERRQRAFALRASARSCGAEAPAANVTAQAEILVTAENAEGAERKDEKAAPGEPAVRRIYLPNMCDHAYALAAAMRYHGLPSEVLPPSDEETLALGRSLCLGRECLPCFTSLGDIVRRTREPGFVPGAASYFMPTTAGPCRFGQYYYLQRQILDRLGLHELEIMSPTGENSYQGFGEHPLQLRRLTWQGIVGVDLLQKLLHEHRPYERDPGSADRLYQGMLQQLTAAIEAGGGRPAVAALAEAGRRFARLPLEPRDGRPVIALIGEIYVRVNPFTNQQIVRQVERLGGEVWVEPMTEWFYYTNYCLHMFTRATRRYADLVKVVLVDQVQRWDERRLRRVVAGRLRSAHEPTVAHLADLTRLYYDPILGTEAVMGVGKAIAMARQGLDGILNLLPFTCMPGTIVAGLAPRIRADHRQIPWLDVIYDAQGETNLHTRLEAFIYQAQAFRNQNRNGTAKLRLKPKGIGHG